MTDTVGYERRFQTAAATMALAYHLIFFLSLFTVLCYPRLSCSGMSRHESKVRCKTLSVDHKPENPSEKRRIKAAGGEVIFNGCYRVQHENVSPLTATVLRLVWCSGMWCGSVGRWAAKGTCGGMYNDSSMLVLLGRLAAFVSAGVNSELDNVGRVLNAMLREACRAFLVVHR